MRRSLLALSLLCLSTLPLAAHATDIYDFRVFGNYLDGTPFPTFTFSADATGIPTPYVHGSDGGARINIFDANGIPGPSYFQTFIIPYGSGYIGSDFANFGFILGVNPAWLTYSSDASIHYVDYAFHPGTYEADLLGFGDVPNVPLTLTVTPEASPIPEPSSLLLVGTGLLSCATLARRKLQRRANRSTL